MPVQGARADRDRGIRESNSGRKRSERSTTRFIQVHTIGLGDCHCVVRSVYGDPTVTPMRAAVRGAARVGWVRGPLTERYFAKFYILNDEKPPS